MDLKLETTATDTSQDTLSLAPLEVLNNIDVYIAADKFGIPSLKRYSGAKIRNWLRAHAGMKSSGLMTVANKILDCGPS